MKRFETVSGVCSIQLFMLICLTNAVMFSVTAKNHISTFREETFAKDIFAEFILAIYDIICKDLFHEKKESVTSYRNFYDFQGKHTEADFQGKHTEGWTKFAKICYTKQCFWVIELQKQVPQKFLSQTIPSLNTV